MMFGICKVIDMVLPEEKIWALVVIILAGGIFYCAGLVLLKDPMVEAGIKILKKQKV